MGRESHYFSTQRKLGRDGEVDNERKPNSTIVFYEECFGWGNTYGDGYNIGSKPHPFYDRKPSSYYHWWRNWFICLLERNFHNSVIHLSQYHRRLSSVVFYFSKYTFSSISGGRCVWELFLVSRSWAYSYPAPYPTSFINFVGAFRICIGTGRSP